MVARKQNPPTRIRGQSRVRRSGKFLPALKTAARLAAPVAAGTGAGFLAYEGGAKLLGSRAGKGIGKAANYMASDLAGAGATIGLDRALRRKGKNARRAR